MWGYIGIYGLVMVLVNLIKTIRNTKKISGVVLSIITVKMIKQYSIKESKLYSLEKDYLNSK